ncbi:hypothetical protein F5X97DRAFT_338488 [Nemania serpens]|nr:hypothetical protein F5X97DRAFT_338488 [Nemania serpens]
MSKPYARAFTVFAVLSGALASPLLHKIENIVRLTGRDRLINGDARLPGGDHQFNNVVCSGSSTADVQAYQFYDEDTPNQPSWQFGRHCHFFHALHLCIANCWLGLPLGAGPSQRSCDEQRQVSWDLINSADLVNSIDQTIKKVIEKGRSGTIGDSFKLYLTGFPQFFNAETEACNEVTFARTANPDDDGKEHTKMTMEIRREFNDMSVQLNKAIEDAVARNSNQGVSWVPIDGEMDGHRFCEEGVQEPDQNNDKLWLFHYPYNEPKDDAVDGPLQEAFDKVTAGVDINTAFKTYNDFQNALLDALPHDANATGILDSLWNSIGYRVKVFHPQVLLHEKIQDLVLDRYVRDIAPPAPSFEEKNACHGISGDYWVMSRDVAVANAKAFCNQSNNDMEYNMDSVNELELSVRNLVDDSKSPLDTPECLHHFRDDVIDGCDGNNQLLNPHNFKFGSIFTSKEGWEYKMTPLSKQVNEVSCGVSYKFLFDSFEIRGGNLPAEKFGANGEGLKSQLSGCGAITNWKFEQTPDDVKFQWYASGHLPIGTKGCVGRALVSAGGSDSGNCHGSGKRAGIIDRRHPISIDDWPGYGDESRHVFKDEMSG